MAEKDWITRYFAPLATSGARQLNDDAGLLAPAGDWQLVTTDALVEGVHFLPQQSAYEVAVKLVRVNVSDVLAKGARPSEALLTLGWPMGAHSSGYDIEDFARGLKDELAAWDIGLVGGDTVTSPVFFASLTLTGKPVAEGLSPVWQSGANPGDVLLLSGKIGGSVGLAHARAGKSTEASNHYRMPILPPIEAAELVSCYGSASTDVSDGLLADLQGILKNSGVGSELDLAHVRFWRESGDVPDLLAQSTGGDDYQILCTAPVEGTKQLIASGFFYEIGRITAQDGLRITHQGERVNLPVTLGFEHGA